MTFVDTNVLVYFVDCRDSRKQSVARTVLARALGSTDYIVSMQVLNEFANVAIKKLHMTDDDVIEYIDAFSEFTIQAARFSWTRRALELKKEYGIQFYDALMVAAAESGGCDTILTEDLNDGQVYAGVKAINPFTKSA